MTKSDAKATPAPWRISKIGITNDGGQIIVADGKTEQNPDSHTQVCVVAMRDDNAPKRNAHAHPCAERDANAALIVQSVNEREALLAVAEAASKLADIDFMSWQKRFQIEAQLELKDALAHLTQIREEAKG